MIARKVGSFGFSLYGAPAYLKETPHHALAFIAYDRLRGSAIDSAQVTLGTEPGSTLGLTDAETDRISAGNLAIGDPNTGNITVTGAMTFPGSVALTNAGTSTIQ